LGSQKYKGNKAPFEPKTIKNITAMTVNIPSCPSSATRSDSCAMFTVPVMEYSQATAMTNNADAKKFSMTYLNDSHSLYFKHPLTISTYEDNSMTSKNTNRLNISPVRNAPFTPTSRKK